MAYNQQTQQEVAGMSYLCCGGNPWDDIFGASNEETTQQKPQAQAQNWNNPFGAYNQPPIDTVESRYGDDSTVGGRSDVRSITSRGSHDRTPVSPPRRTNLGGKTLWDIEREDRAMFTALRLQEEMANDDNSQMTAEGASVLTSDRMARKQDRKQTYKDPEVAAKTAAVNRAVNELQTLRKYKRSVQQTETTRPKKGTTPEDVRDPETISGMKCKADIETEEKAKTKAFQMISFGKFKYDRNAGLAIMSSDESNYVQRKDKGNVQEIV